MKRRRGNNTSHQPYTTRELRETNPQRTTRRPPQFPRDPLFGWTTRKLRYDAFVRHNTGSRRLAEHHAHGKKTGKRRNTAKGTFVPEHSKRRFTAAALMGGGY